jgi:hypothetical protein
LFNIIANTAVAILRVVYIVWTNVVALCKAGDEWMEVMVVIVGRAAHSTDQHRNFQCSTHSLPYVETTMIVLPIHATLRMVTAMFAETENFQY